MVDKYENMLKSTQDERSESKREVFTNQTAKGIGKQALLYTINIPHFIVLRFY